MNSFVKMNPSKLEKVSSSQKDQKNGEKDQPIELRITNNFAEVKTIVDYNVEKLNVKTFFNSKSQKGFMDKTRSGNDYKKVFCSGNEEKECVAGSDQSEVKTGKDNIEYANKKDPIVEYYHLSQLSQDGMVETVNSKTDHVIFAGSECQVVSGKVLNKFIFRQIEGEQFLDINYRTETDKFEFDQCIRTDGLKNCTAMIARGEWKFKDLSKTIPDVKVCCVGILHSNGLNFYNSSLPEEKVKNAPKKYVETFKNSLPIQFPPEASKKEKKQDSDQRNKINDEEVICHETAERLLISGMKKQLEMIRNKIIKLKTKDLNYIFEKGNEFVCVIKQYDSGTEYILKQTEEKKKAKIEEKDEIQEQTETEIEGINETTYPNTQILSQSSQTSSNYSTDNSESNDLGIQLIGLPKLSDRIGRSEILKKVCSELDYAYFIDPYFDNANSLEDYSLSVYSFPLVDRIYVRKMTKKQRITDILVESPIHRAEFGLVRNDIIELKKDVTERKNDFEGLQKRISEVEKRITKIESRMTKLEKIVKSQIGIEN